MQIDGSGYVAFPSESAVQLKRESGQLSDKAAGALRLAATHLIRATRYDANNALYALTNAWAFEQLAGNWQAVMGTESLGEIGSEKDAWAKVAAEYRRAYSMGKDPDVKAKNSRPASPNAFPSVLAAKSLLRLRDKGDARVTAAEAARLKAHVAKFS